MSVLKSDNYDSLFAEYRDSFHRNEPDNPVAEPSSTASVIFGSVFAGIIVAAYTAVKHLNIYIIVGAAAFTSALLIFALLKANSRVRANWNKTEELVKTAAEAYDCAVGDVGWYVRSSSKSTRTYAVFKFTYNKNGAPVTDMCELMYAGNFKGNIWATKITLYETRQGEKVLSVKVSGKPEHRLIY